MMQLGAEGVFVGSGIFESGKEFPEGSRERLDSQRRMATAIVKAVTHFNDPQVLAEVSMDIPDSMRGQSVAQMPVAELLAGRGN